MVRNAKRFDIATRLKTKFTKRAHSEIEKMIESAQQCIIHMARNNQHEVELNGVSYSVDMNQRTCGCRKWQMVGIPCEHAASVIIGKRQKLDDYVSEYYSTEMWRRTYLDGISPVQGMKLWPRMRRLPVLPPPWRKGNPGRPSNYARKRGRNETVSTTNKQKLSRKFRVMTCSNCREDGHNKQTCKNPTVGPVLRKRSGGQRKKVDGTPLMEAPPLGIPPQSSQGYPSQSSQGYPSQSSQSSQGLPPQSSQGLPPQSSQSSHGSRWISWFQCST